MTNVVWHWAPKELKASTTLCVVYPQSDQGRRSSPRGLFRLWECTSTVFFLFIFFFFFFFFSKIKLVVKYPPYTGTLKKNHQRTSWGTYLMILTQYVPNGHTTLKWRRINVDATWSRRIDVDTTSFWCCVPAGNFSDFLYKSIFCRCSFELHRLVEAIQMRTNNICFYKEVDTWPVIWRLRNCLIVRL